MPRPQRTDHPDAVHHVSCRVNWRRFHLEHAAQAEIYFDELDAALEAFDVELLASAQMSNHHHVILRSPPKERYRRLTSRITKCGHWRPYPQGHCNSMVLSQLMRRLHRVVAVKLQLKLGLSGHFWGKRYHSREIRDSIDLTATIAYDHRNPVRAGMTLHPEDYAFSTAAAYAGSLADSRVPLAPESRLPFGLTWEKLQGAVRVYQSSKAVDDIFEAMGKMGITPGHPDYETTLHAAIRKAGLAT